MRKNKMRCRPLKQNIEHVQFNEIKARLERDGIESFVPDAERALLMSIRGYRTAKCIYNGDGVLQRMTEEYVGPNYQAALVFLKTFCAEKYGNMSDARNNFFVGNNVFSPQFADADVERIKRVAGSLLEIKAIESHEGSPSPTPPI